jgi:hypothetical protein
MQIQFDNFLADWKTDQTRVPMNHTSEGETKELHTRTYQTFPHA